MAVFFNTFFILFPFSGLLNSLKNVKSLENTNGIYAKE
jgi:hypothetical protein